MDDMSAFERQLAARLQHLAGPEPTLDVAASVRAATSSSARWTFPSVFSAARLVVAGAIVALFSGFLLAGLLTSQPSAEPMPGAASPTASTDPLSSMDTESVEPGVRRVVSDGVRDLDWEASFLPTRSELVVTSGDVWVRRGDVAVRLGTEGDHVIEDQPDPPLEAAIDEDGSVAFVEAEYQFPPTWSPAPREGTGDPLYYGADYALGPGQVAWERRDTILRRHTPSGTEVFTRDDDTPRFEGNSPSVGPRMVVVPDGSVWFSLYSSSASSDCGGVVHYDGRTSTYYLRDRGFCVSAMDVDARGRLWVLGFTAHSDTDEPGNERDRVYVIDASGTDLDRQDRENDMDPRMSPRATAVAAMSLATALAAATAPVATAQDLQPTMSEFTGRLGCGTAGPSSEAVSWRFPVVEISDERFDGTYVNQLAGYEDGDPDVDGVGAYSALWEITNEEGGWVGHTTTFRFPPGSYSTTSVALEGQGAYAGLTAIMEGDFTDDCGFDIRGVVVDGELPSTPEAVMAAE